jgi:hypothetical protein
MAEQLEKVESAPPAPFTFNLKEFLGGFFGWFLVNGLIWLIVGGPGENFNAAINLFIFPINLLALIILSIIKRTRNIGLGILSALAFNLLLSLVLGTALNGFCFVPFMFPIE